MAIEDLIFPKRRVSFTDGIKIVELDVSADELHNAENDVSEYPVEEGSSISDNSRPKPRTLSISGFVTSAPLSNAAYTTAPGLKKLRGKTAWSQLDIWRKAGTRLTVRTTFYAYVDVIIQSIAVPRNVKNSNGVELTISLRQVFTTASKTVAKPVRGQKPQKTNVGKKSTKPATDSQDAEGRGFLDSLGGG
jgi:hypothetical protein